jgi:flagellar hook assembly protein FlgD
LDSGDHRVVWDGRDSSGRPVGSGVYLYRLSAGGEVRSRTMVLIK